LPPSRAARRRPTIIAGSSRPLSEPSKYSATPVAATAPSMNWPSAPMFHTLARKPIASPIAHSISGVALSSSSETL
jgi:hypothetical protein